ncbi:dihydrolipoyl dehydrogenase [candidate division KSB1 bacterium]|nr:dihydrolipoyl dehydrogenase [candidate division KSB1 bacterium]
MSDKYDLVVFGSGPGGYVAAIRAAQLGQKTAVVERAELGGICLNWGCIPTKALLQSATLFEQIKKAQNFGIVVGEPAVDFEQVVKHSRSVAGRLSKGIEFLFKKNKITHVPGTAEITGKGKIKVKNGKQDTLLEAANVIIATGARPRTIPGMEYDGEKIISSKEAMVLNKLPKSMVIIGAGAIGVEFAYFYASIGTKVTLVEMMPHILPIEDQEIVKVVDTAFRKTGISILAGTKVEKIEKTAKGVKVMVSSPKGQQTVDGDLALVAIGVQGNVEGIGLEKVGIQLEKGYIKVDKRNYKTNVDGFYAIGDVIGPPWLAHVASAEGVVAAETIAGHEATPVDYSNIPGCTYCQPQIASLGLTEEKAKQEGYDIKVGRFPFRANGKSLAMGHSEGLVKIIFDARYGELLGVHIVGAEATELLAELGVAKTLETTAFEIFNTIHAHPTISESIKEAAEDAYGQAIHI